jgi:hypothetical protein
MTHESQDEDRCTEEDKSGLEGLQDKTYQEREDLGCQVRDGVETWA